MRRGVSPPSRVGAGLGFSSVLIARDSIRRRQGGPRATAHRTARHPLRATAYAGGRDADPQQPATDRLAPATRVVALGRDDVVAGGQVGAPLVLSSTYHAGGDVVYARTGNPTWTAFETALGDLEGGDALVLSSGMAAVAAALSLLPHGATVVAPDAAYNGVVATLADREAAGSVTVRRVEVADTDAVLAALDGADLVWLESPTNPLLEVADLATLLAAARRARRAVRGRQHLRHALAAASARARRRRRRALGHEVPLRAQ